MAKVAHRFSRLGLHVSLLTQFAVLTACSPQSGGQTGEDGMAPCIDTVTHLPTIDTPTPLGFSASEILAFASMKHQATLQWRKIDGVVTFGDALTDITLGDYSPGPSDASVSFAVAYAGGDIRFVTKKPTSPELPESFQASCRDRLEVDVTVTLKTNDGALDAVFDTTLRANTSQQADWTARLPSSSTLGSFRMLPHTRLASGRVVLFGSLAPLGFTGHLYGELDHPFGAGELTTAGIRRKPYGSNYAQWPAAPDCAGYAVPLDVDLAFRFGGDIGISPNDILALINSSPGVPSNYAGGQRPTITLRVSPNGQTSCYRESTDPLAQGAPTLNLLGRLHATTDDAALSTDIPVRIEALPDWKGGISWAKVVVDSPLDSGVVPAELWTRLGLAEVDQGDYDVASCSFFTTFVPITSGTIVSGKLEVFRYSGASCLEDLHSDACRSDLFESVWWSSH